MKRPNFLEGVAVALIVSVVGSALAWGLAPLIGRNGAKLLLITGIGLVYLVYLLVRSEVRVGRITTVAIWIALTGLAWIAGMPLLLLLLLQLGFIWLVRSLYFYSSPLAGLLDLGLISVGSITALWAIFYTGSLFLGLWTFFLTQALFIAIPSSWRADSSSSQTTEKDSFARAYRSAEAAVRKLSAIR